MRRQILIEIAGLADVVLSEHPDDGQSMWDVLRLVFPFYTQVVADLEPAELGLISQSLQQLTKKLAQLCLRTMTPPLETISDDSIIAFQHFIQRSRSLGIFALPYDEFLALWQQRRLD